jgi:hypothetical protein
VEVVETVFLHCVFQGVQLLVFEVGKNWPLTHMRQELHIALGNEAPRDFSFEVMEQGVPNRKVNARNEGKVNARNEGKVLAGDVLPPKLLLVVEHP